MIASHWKGKLLGPEFRLQWNRDEWLLEELPQKGKKKLRIAKMSNMGGRYSSKGNFDALIPENILRVAHVSPSDTFDHVKEKIEKAMRAASEETLKKKSAEGDKSWDFILQACRWDEEQVYFTKVMPEGMEPLQVKAKDFEMKVEWTDFKAYSPDSDFQSHDPSYTLCQASSPGAARKLYQMAKEDPSLLAHVPWTEFKSWLDKNKIGSATHFSSHR